jgi:hypothetical protein
MIQFPDSKRCEYEEETELKINDYEIIKEVKKKMKWWKRT